MSLSKGKGPTCWQTPQLHQLGTGAALGRSWYARKALMAPHSSYHGTQAWSHQELPGTTGKSLHCSPAQPQMSQRDRRGAGGSLPWRQVTCPAPEAPTLPEVFLDPGKGNQEACGHRHQPGQDLGADSWLMGNDKLMYWLFTCAQIRWLRNLGAYRD